MSDDRGLLVAFKVLGDPAPQGSKTRMPNGAVVEGRSTTQRAKHHNWRSAVAEAAIEQWYQVGTLVGPLNVSVVFRVRMPQSRTRAERTRGWCWRVGAPDLDKLIRALGDGLQASGLISDDARIVTVMAAKIETVGWTGADVTIMRAGEP